jgi:tRNA(Ile)-lysidine synthase
MVESLKQDFQLNQNDPIVIGVSGGKDSLSLVHAMKEQGYSIYAAHLNHSLRPEADLDAQMLLRTMERFNIASIIEKQDVRSFAADQRMSIEEAAREVRYRYLFLQASQYHAQAVLVAHTADDQVETVLMHLLRGSGLAGLRGMRPWSLPNPWSEKIPLVRPLLSVWRSEIDAYCVENHLTPIEDQSNQDTTFYRNRLRHELIPLLERNYNPGVRKLLWQMTNILAEDFTALESSVDFAWQTCVMEQREDSIAFSPSSLLVQPLGIRRQLVRRGVALLLPNLRDVDYDSVNRSLTFLEEQMVLEDGAPSTRQDLCAGLRLVFERQRKSRHLPAQDRLWILKHDLPSPSRLPKMEPTLVIPLQIPREISLGSWRFVWEVCINMLAAQKEASENKDPFQAWVDLGNLPPSALVLRTRRNGERFQPLGMEGRSLKISDFMINAKIPQLARSCYPLVSIEDCVVWVPGYHIGHYFRLTPESKHVIHFRMTCS